LYCNRGRAESISGASALKFNFAVFFKAGLKVDVMIMDFFRAVSCALVIPGKHNPNIKKQRIPFIIWF
jgi:hypothetical protein